MRQLEIKLAQGNPKMFERVSQGGICFVMGGETELDSTGTGLDWIGNCSCCNCF